MAASPAGPYGFGANSPGMGPFRSGTYKNDGTSGAPPYGFGATSLGTGPFRTGSYTGVGSGAPPTASAYFNPGGGFNPAQFATDTTAQGLANMVGGSVYKTNATQGGPYTVPQQNLVYASGFSDPMNAGLMQKEIDTFGLENAKQMWAAQNAYGNAQAAKQAAAGNPVATGLYSPQIGKTPTYTASGPATSPLPAASTVAQQNSLYGQPPQNSAQSYINSILGGQGNAGQNPLMGLFSLLGGNAVNSGGNNPLFSLLSSLFGQSSPYNFTGNRYSMFM